MVHFFKTNLGNAQLMDHFKDLHDQTPELKQYLKFFELLPRKDYTAEAVEAFNRKVKDS